MKVLVNGIKLQWDQSIFPGGEVYVRITNLDDIKDERSPRVEILGTITSANKLLEVDLIIDAIYHATTGFPEVYWHIGYMPNARQDRVCAPGESLAIGAFAVRLFSTWGLRQVTIDDIHSESAKGIVEAAAENYNVDVVFNSQVECYWEKPVNIDPSNLILLAPDAGAEAKTKKLRDVMYPSCEVVTASKVRKDGRISVELNYPSRLEGKDVLIVDDICDGGGTFLALADAVEQATNVKSLNLWVTHGIFSKGRTPLLRRFTTVNAYYDWTKGE